MKILTLARGISALLVVLAVPSGARKDLFFGVPVPPGFRSTEVGRRALRTYVLVNAIPMAALLFGLILRRTFPALEVAAQLAFPVVAIASYVVQYRRLKPYAVQSPLVREMSLSPPERLPWFTWFGYSSAAVAGQHRLLSALALGPATGAFPGLHPSERARGMDGSHGPRGLWRTALGRRVSRLVLHYRAGGLVRIAPN